MTETSDGAFCPKMNSDPRLVCVSFLCGRLVVVQLGFFFLPLCYILFFSLSALSFLLSVWNYLLYTVKTSD